MWLMVPEVPMRLILGEKLFGHIVSYFYATPWAEGKIEPIDREHHARLVIATEFLDWLEEQPDAPTDEEDEAIYDQELERRGITEEDVESISRGPWTIIPKDGEEQRIHWPMFDRDGFITWRW